MQPVGRSGARAAAFPGGRGRPRRGAWARPAWWASVAVLAVAAGAGLGAPPIASAALDAALSRALGAQRIHVTLVARPPAALWWGHVDVLTVAARNLAIGALEVRAFDATFRGVRLDPEALYLGRQIVVRSAGAGEARAVVSQEALARLLGAQPSLRDVSVTLGGGRVRVAATVSLLGTSLRAAGEGRLVLDAGRGVDLVLDRVSVAGVPLPPAAAAQVARSINPVLDARALPFGLRITGVRVGDGEAVVGAAAGAR